MSFAFTPLKSIIYYRFVLRGRSYLTDLSCGLPRGRRLRRYRNRRLRAGVRTSPLTLRWSFLPEFRTFEAISSRLVSRHTDMRRSKHLLVWRSRHRSAREIFHVDSEARLNIYASSPCLVFAQHYKICWLCICNVLFSNEDLINYVIRVSAMVCYFLSVGAAA